MEQTPRIGLTVTPASDNQKLFIDFRSELAGDTEDSNMMIIDGKIGQLLDAVEEIDETQFTWSMLKNGRVQQNNGGE